MKKTLKIISASVMIYNLIMMYIYCGLNNIEVEILFGVSSIIATIVFIKLIEVN